MVQKPGDYLENGDVMFVDEMVSDMEILIEKGSDEFHDGFYRSVKGVMSFMKAVQPYVTKTTFGWMFDSLYEMMDSMERRDTYTAKQSMRSFINSAKYLKHNFAVTYR